MAAIDIKKHTDGASFNVSFGFNDEALKSFRDTFEYAAMRDPLTNKFSHFNVAGIKDGIGGTLDAALEQFSKTWEPAISKQQKQGEAARAFVAAYNAQPAEKQLPGLRLDVKASSVAVYTQSPDGVPLVIDDARRHLMAVATYVRYSDGEERAKTDRERGNKNAVATPTGGYFLVKPGTPDAAIQRALILTAGAIVTHQRTANHAATVAVEAMAKAAAAYADKNLKAAFTITSGTYAPDPKKPAMRVPAVFIATPRDKGANDIIKKHTGAVFAGAQRDQAAHTGAFAIPITSPEAAASLSKNLTTAITELSAYLDKQVVKATLEQPGLNKESLAALAALKDPGPGANAAQTAAYQKGLDSGQKLLTGIFSGDELEAISTGQPGDADRLKGLSATQFDTLKTTCDTIFQGVQQVQDRELAAAEAALALNMAEPSIGR